MYHESLQKLKKKLLYYLTLLIILFIIYLYENLTTNKTLNY